MVDKKNTILMIALGAGIVAGLFLPRLKKQENPPVLADEGPPQGQCDDGGQVYVDILTGDQYVCNGDTHRWELVPVPILNGPQGPQGVRGSFWNIDPIDPPIGGIGGELPGDQWLNTMTGEVWEWS